MGRLAYYMRMIYGAARRCRKVSMSLSLGQEEIYGCTEIRAVPVAGADHRVQLCALYPGRDGPAYAACSHCRWRRCDLYGCPLYDRFRRLRNGPFRTGYGDLLDLLRSGGHSFCHSGRRPGRRHGGHFPDRLFRP